MVEGGEVSVKSFLDNSAAVPYIVTAVQHTP